jgi:hypothetical protein
MGHWEDFWWETHEELEKLGLRIKFDEQLEKMRYQEKHQFKDSRERWRYALAKVIEIHRKSKSPI